MAENFFNRLIPQKFIYFQNFFYTIKEQDTLVDLAVYFKVGYYHLILANPGIDPWVPPVGSKVIIPKKILIPEEFLNTSNAIVINIAEKRLYYFKNSYFFVAPIGIGVEGSLPPLGVYTVVDKKKKPYWYPPPSIKKEDPSLPDCVPPGPENPMGEYALYLSRGLYAIHGTNKVYSIGRRTTHGCFRLYPEHIEFLYKNVPIGTIVKIVYEPYKVAFQNGKIYLQVYPDFEKKIKNPFFYVFQKIEKLSELKKVNFQIDLFELEKALKNQDGKIYLIGEIK